MWLILYHRLSNYIFCSRIPASVYFALIFPAQMLEEEWCFSISVQSIQPGTIHVAALSCRVVDVHCPFDTPIVYRWALKQNTGLHVTGISYRASFVVVVCLLCCEVVLEFITWWLCLWYCLVILRVYHLHCCFLLCLCDCVMRVHVYIFVSVFMCIFYPCCCACYKFAMMWVLFICECV